MTPVGASCTCQPLKGKGRTGKKSSKSAEMDLGTVDAAGRSNNREESGHSGPQSTTACQKAAKRKHLSTTEVMDKLNTVIDKVSALERRIDTHNRSEVLPVAERLANLAPNQ